MLDYIDSPKQFFPATERILKPSKVASSIPKILLALLTQK